MNELSKKETKFKRIIVALSIIIPLAVAILFRVKIEGYDFGFLPSVYASINAVTAVTLLIALWAIKNGKRSLHQKLMTTSLVLSALFLVLYIIYHITSTSTSYGGEGMIRTVYFIILISHIILSVAVVPLVLFTYLRAYLEDFDRHKQLARITFPIWLYVAISGVIVYLMISPYYQ
jgi:putative membrane protein